MKSKFIDFLIVSTDDIEIAEISQKFGCPVIQRPFELATDTATSEDVLRHALRRLPTDWVVLLQPTSPTRTSEDIDACIEIAQLGSGCISAMNGQPNGAVYVATAEWLAHHDFSDLSLFKYEMEPEYSLVIDNEEDFDRRDAVN